MADEGGRYPWKIDTRLAVKVQAKDSKTAENNPVVLTDFIYNARSRKSMDEVKLRVVQMVTIASRSAYYAEANPEKLVDINLKFMDKILHVTTKKRLLSLIKCTILRFISLVPDEDLLGTSKLNQVIGYIRTPCTENLSRDTVVAFVDCSPSHLSTLFLRIAGNIFKEIVLKYLMEKAKEFLRESRKSINKVAFAVGHEDPNYFTAAFISPPDRFSRWLWKDGPGDRRRDGH